MNLLLFPDYGQRQGRLVAQGVLQGADRELGREGDRLRQRGRVKDCQSGWHGALGGSTGPEDDFMMFYYLLYVFRFLTCNIQFKDCD